MRSVLNNSIARRWGWSVLCLLPWLVVLAVPLWRSILVAELPRLSEGDLHEMKARNPSGWMIGIGWWMDSDLDGRQPQPLNIQVVLHQNQPDFNKLDDFLRQSYRRHSDQQWLLATMLSIEVYQLQELSKLYAIPRGRIVPFLRKAFSSARLGYHCEPHNAYYLWMLANIYLLNHQNKQALEALHQATTRPYFDNHWRELTRAWIDYQSFKRYGQGNLVEDVLWSSIRSQADQGWAKIMDLAVSHRNCPDASFTSFPCFGIQSRLVALAMLRSTQEPGSSWLFTAFGDNFVWWSSTYQNQIGTTIDQAYSSGNFDFALEMYQQYGGQKTRFGTTSIEAVKRMLKWPENSMRALLTPGTSRALRTICWTERALVLESGITSLFLILLYLLVIPWGMNHVAFSRKDLNLSILMMSVGTLIFVWKYIAGAPTVILGPGRNGSVLIPIIFISNGLQGILVSAAGILFVTWARQNQDEPNLIGLTISWVRQVRQVFAPSSVPIWFRAISWLLLFGAIQVFLIGAVMAYYDGYYGYYRPYARFFEEFPMNFDAVVFGALILLTPYMLWHMIYWRWLMPAQHRAAAHYALQWFRWTLITSIGISGVIYLVLLVASIPYREAAKRQWNEALQPYHYQSGTPKAPPLPIR